MKSQKRLLVLSISADQLLDVGSKVSFIYDEYMLRHDCSCFFIQRIQYGFNRFKKKPNPTKYTKHRKCQHLEKSNNFIKFVNFFSYVNEHAWFKNMMEEEERYQRTFSLVHDHNNNILQKPELNFENDHCFCLCAVNAPRISNFKGVKWSPNQLAMENIWTTWNALFYID